MNLSGKRRLSARGIVKERAFLFSSLVKHGDALLIISSVNIELIKVLSMTKLLHIDASILGDHSASRVLTADVVGHYKAQTPDLEVTYRDVAAQPLSHLDVDLLSQLGKAVPADAARHNELTEAAEILSELEAADILVIGVPMYNFGMPTQLKAWIDRLLIAGRTFRYVPQGVEGLLSPKKVVLVASRGGIYSEGSPWASAEHSVSHVRAALAMMGLTDVKTLVAEALSREGGVNRNAILTAVQEEITAL